MKKISRRLLSVLLIIAMLIPTGMMGITSTAAGNYITELATSHIAYTNPENSEHDSMLTKAYLHDKNFNIIDYDLNKGVYGDYIYLGYKTGSDGAFAIRGLKVSRGLRAVGAVTSVVNGTVCTFYPVMDINGSPCNLNLNSSIASEPIYLYYTTDRAAGNPISSISVSTFQSGNTVTYFDSSTAANLNCGSSSKSLYLSYTTAADNSTAGRQFPAGYDFYEDSYQFDNGKATISKKYFTTLFGKEQGKLLYKKEKNASSGVCFGMAYTTAAFYQGLPSLSVNVRDIGTKTTIRIGNNVMSVRDYILYSYIYQFSSNEWEIIKPSSTSEYAPTLYTTVKNNLQNNVLVPITMHYVKKNSKNEWNHVEGHEVLAVGIEGNKILVDDPNNPDSLEYIEIYGDGSWYFSGRSWGTKMSSTEVCGIGYSLNVHKPYQLLASGTHTTVHSDKLGKSTSADVSTETYVEGMQKLDTDKLLMYVDSDEYSIDSENLIEINGVIGTDETAETDAESLYWVSEDKTVTVSDIKGENNEIIVAGNDVSVSVNTQDSSVVTLTVDEENNDVSAKINSTQGNQYTISFESTDDSENDITTTLTGTANGTEVTATETDNGVQVTGLNNITATYETADGTDTEDIEIENGETVNIVVNDEENSVDVEWNCSHLCHNDNAFMQFIWKIINFLSKIFGASQYCDCGMKHW